MDSQPEFWHWLVLGVMLIMIELVIPAAYFLGLGAAALLLGTFLSFGPQMSLEAQILIFSGLSLISIVLAKRYFKARPIESDQPLLNRRGHQYVGRNFTLEDAIVNGQGKIRVDDSTWKIVGADCDAGSVITVTGVDGVLLKVSLREDG